MTEFIVDNYSVIIVSVIAFFCIGGTISLMRIYTGDVPLDALFIVGSLVALISVFVVAVADITMDAHENDIIINETVEEFDVNPKDVFIIEKEEKSLALEYRHNRIEVLVGNKIKEIMRDKEGKLIFLE